MRIRRRAPAVVSALLLFARFASSQEPATRGGAVGKMSEADKEWAKPWEVVFDYDEPPKPIKITRPQYPQAAFVRKIEGTVVLRIVIDAEGYVPHDRVQVLNSIPGLDEAAVQCIRAWRFRPALKDGQPVATMARAPVGFRIFSGPVKPADTRLGPLAFDSDGADFAAWLKQFKPKVNAHWSVPDMADPGLRGHVDLDFVVERDGKVSDVQTLKSSGAVEFDRAATNALRATRFPHLAADYKPERVTMHVSFSFNEGEPPQANP